MGEAVSDLLAAAGALGVVLAMVVSVSACCFWAMRHVCAPPRRGRARAEEPPAVPSAVTPPRLMVLKDTRGGIALIDQPDGGNCLGLRQPK